MGAAAGSGKRFPFGAVVRECVPNNVGASDVFVLGAYPSALYITWTPPTTLGLRSVSALPVDNEPEPFWSGADVVDRFEAWQAAVGWEPEYGEASATERFNGTSGRWVETNVLDRLGVDREQAWITDCLTTYRMSNGVEKAISAVFLPFAETVGIEAERTPQLERHPSENEIVREALAIHRARIKRELESAHPQIAISLGNAAMRVLRNLLGDPGPDRLDPSHYGRVIEVDGLRWYALAHPGAPRVYQEAHSAWTP